MIIYNDDEKTPEYWISCPHCGKSIDIGEYIKAYLKQRWNELVKTMTGSTTWRKEKSSDGSRWAYDGRGPANEPEMYPKGGNDDLH